MNISYPVGVQAASTFVEILRWRAAHQPARKAYTFLVNQEGGEKHLTYGELDKQARCVAASLQHQGFHNERILLLYPPGLPYIAAFLGCLYAGCVAVPCYPPRLNRPDPRLQAVVADSQAKVALTTTHILGKLERRFAHMPDLQALHWLATDTDALAAAADWQESAVTPGNSLAFLQYTSGSTGTPKGVMLTHDNLISNSALIYDFFGNSPESFGVFWLPPYHDMGLIGSILQPLYGGFPVVLMSPVDFLQRPFCWLQAMSHYQATGTGAPNFAYDLCVRKITPEEKEQLDLSHWEMAFTGAEPIRPETLERFATAFAPCGFRPQAFYPCYGLAEATLLVSGGTKMVPPTIRSFDTAALAQKHVVPTTEGQTFVGCGRTLPGQQIKIVDPQTRLPCADDEIGEIWLAGPSIAQGYWNQPQVTAYTFQAFTADSPEGPFMRTGDLGFLLDGELFITGRLKDLIIVRGRNYYPQDIEKTAEQSHEALESNANAAFSVDINQTEQVVLVQEVKRSHRRADVSQVTAAVREAVAQTHELQLYGVVLIKPRSIPLTSSGKIQRHACREQFLDGSLNVIGQHLLAADTAPQESLIAKSLKALADPDARHVVLTFYVQEQIARLLPPASTPLAATTPLTLEEPTAVSLQQTFNASLGITLPLTTLTQPTTPQDLAHRLLALWGGGGETLATRPFHLLLLSAATADALDAATTQLTDYLHHHPHTNLADMAYTLQHTQNGFAHRRMLVTEQVPDTLAVLTARPPQRLLTLHRPPADRSVVFLFPGVGDHYLQMAQGLYDTEPLFRHIIDECSQVLYPHLHTTLPQLLYPTSAKTAPDTGLDLRAMLKRTTDESPAAQRLNETTFIHPVLFAIEYALAQLLISWGVQPQAMVGYSLGEYVAACIAGVLSLPDALRLVAKRAQLIQTLPPGRMLTIPLPLAAVAELLTDDISLAGHTGDNLCVVAGATTAIAALQAQLAQQKIACNLLDTTHAFHSHMMHPMQESLIEFAQQIPLHPPCIPYISNVTGTWITTEQAIDPTYWSQHMCQPVRFFEALQTLLPTPEQILLEVGPGQSLGAFARQHPACTPAQMRLILPTMRYGYDQQSDVAFLLESLGKLWLLGIEPDWTAFYAHEEREQLTWQTAVGQETAAMTERQTRGEKRRARVQRRQRRVPPS